MFSDLIKKAAETAKMANFDPENEYVNEADGLVYCSKCRTKKQIEVSFAVDSDGMPITIRPYVPCKCKLEEIERQEREQESRERRERIERLKRASGIPELYADATFDVYKTNASNGQIFKMAQRYAKEFYAMVKAGKGLLLHGNIGTGKTYTAACIGNAVLDQGYSVFMTSTKEMLKLRSTEEEERYAGRIIQASLLIVDDLGSERSSEYGRERVLNYIDERCSAEAPMILTTNLDFNRMVNPETEEEGRIYDRILKRCFPIAFKGESWRRSEARDNFAEMKKILQGGD